MMFELRNLTTSSPTKIITESIEALLPLEGVALFLVNFISNTTESILLILLLVLSVLVMPRQQKHS